MTVAVKNRQPVIVPPAALRRAGFRSGQELEVKASGGVITIVAKLPSARDEYTPKARRVIGSRLARADEDIRSGRVYGPFNSSEEMAASVEANIRKLRAAKRKAKLAP